MLHHVFLSLLVSLLMLAVMYQWCRLQHGPLPSKGAGRSLLPRHLKPCTPLECPACCSGSSPSSMLQPAPAAVRPWREVKSRRGVPKRVKTEGFACCAGYLGHPFAKKTL